MQEHPEGPDGPDRPVELPIEDILDLHTFRPAEVQELVRDYLAAAREKGFDRVRIIHGRGIGVLREVVRATLARDASVASFHDAEPEHGGWGATVVRLKRSGSSRPA